MTDVLERSFGVEPQGWTGKERSCRDCMNFVTKIPTVDRGRPKIRESERKTKSFTICLKLDTYKKLKKLAEENRQPTSTMVRLIVEDAVEGKG